MAIEGRLTMGRGAKTSAKPYIFLMSGDAWAGAMQAGVLDALAGMKTLPSGIVASGFGAINAVIAASNPPSLWRAKLMAFWERGSWIEWVAHGLSRSSLGVAADALKFSILELVDWQRLNAGYVRCQLILPSSGGGYRVVDTARDEISPIDVLESVLTNLRYPSSLDIEPEDAALNEIGAHLEEGWVGFEIGLPPVSPSPPTDTSRVRRRDWIERWHLRASRATQIGGELVRVPWDADRRRPSLRSYRPYALYSRGVKAAYGPIDQSGFAAQIPSDGDLIDLTTRHAVVNRLRSNVPADDLSVVDVGLQKINRVVGILYKTVRRPAVTSKNLSYSGDRDSAHYGAAEISIPHNRKIGEIARPFKIGIWGFEIELKEEEGKHFKVKAITEMHREDWLHVLKNASSKEALVFVHGFNVEFQDALFRFAQIVWDLGYGGLPVLYSWASRGSVLDYPYDRNSALIGRIPFLELLGDLSAQGVTRVHILAHSMGNLLVLDALSTHTPPQPLGIDELVMAAPDIDVDQYKLIAPMARKLTKGMTLYASSADRALAISRKIAGKMQRAGDVIGDEPVLVDQVDTIDASVFGTDLMGLNHSHYATDRSILNDLKRLFADGKRPPPERGVGLDAIPNSISPAWWKFVV